MRSCPVNVFSHGQMNRGSKTLLLRTGSERQVRLILPRLVPLHSPAWQLQLLAVLDSPSISVYLG